MKTIDVLHLPNSLWLGRRGENQFRPIAINWDTWHRDYPDATLSVIYHRPDGNDFIVATSTTTPLIWIPMQDATTVSGIGELEMHLVGDPEIGISAHVDTIIDDSRSSASVVDAPAWADKVVQDVSEAASHYPQIVGGYWYVWDVDTGEWVNTNVKASGEEIDPTDIADAVEDYMDEHPVEVTETDPTVPAWAKAANPPVASVNGKTGTVALDAVDVHALPDSTVIPEAVTEQDVAGWGFTKNTGTYSKPSGGIPKSDLASAVQASLEKADTALQTAPVISVNNKTGAVVLGASDVGALPASTPIPTVPTNVSAFTNDAGYQTAQDVQGAIINSRFDDLDYIEADGQSYFDTGILPSADLEIEVSFRHKTAESVLLAARQFVFGSYAKNGSTVIDRCQFANGGNAPVSQGSTNSGICGWNGAWSSIEQAPLPVSDFATVTANATAFKKGTVTFYTPTAGTFDANALSIYLFGCHVPSGDTFYLANGVQIASAIFRKNGVVIASYEPKQDKVTGAKGFVNAVNGLFTPMTSTASGDVTSVNGKTGAVVLDASDVGALPSSTVIPTKVSDLSNDSGFQTAAQVQSAISAAAELPSGGSTGDFLRKTANGVAWQTVPSAESNSFGGGS